MRLEGPALLFAFLVSLVATQTIFDQQNDLTWRDCDVHPILREMRKGFADLQQKMTRIQPSPNSALINYAFHAQLTMAVSNDYVIYDNLLTNEGAAYDKTTGTFTCKFSGTYVFSWTIASSDGRQTRADLLVNEMSVGVTITHSDRGRLYESESVGSSTGFVVYNLQTGDEVKVKVNGTADPLFSTLSGWRLLKGTQCECIKMAFTPNQSA